MSKKHILVFPFNLQSHYLRCIVLMEQYKEYEILFAYSTDYDPVVKKAGHRSFAVETFDAKRVMEDAAKFNFGWLNAKDIERVYVSQVEAIKKLQPHIVIGDTSPTLKMAAEATGTKYISLMNGYMSKYYDGVRNVSRTHYSYEYLKKLPPSIADVITVFAEKAAFRSVHQAFRQLRKKYGLKKIYSYLDELEGDENFICDHEDLFPQKKLPANYKVIGPLMYVSEGNETELIASLDKEKPTVCVCLGSSGSWNELKFLNKPEFCRINFIVAGDKQYVLKGDNMFHKDFVNLNKVLPMCCFMICHGGNGTIYEGLRHRIYMLCLTHHFEQEWNVGRLAQLGLGEAINDEPEEKVKLRLNAISRS